MTVLRTAGALASLGTAIGVGWGATLGAARYTERPTIFLGAGLLAYALTLTPAIWWLARRPIDGSTGQLRAAAIVVAAAVVLVPALWAALCSAPLDVPSAPVGTRYWTLPDGSRLAVLRIPARPRASADPVVFLHGGPGVADMDHDAPVLSRLADSGRDVWLYDQVGAGRSSRLTDPRGYSLERDVTELEQVRRLIGAPRLALIGHSYGATLAATYLARHPEHVSRVVLSSPGRLVPQVGDVSGTGMVGRLDARHRLAVLGTLLRPRAMLTYSLVKVNPRAAHALSGDDEMDSRFVTLYRQSAPGLVCPGSPVPPPPVRPGFYANQVPQSITRAGTDIRPALRRVRVPALVLKGGCDYLPWSFAVDYRRTLPGSSLLYFDDCGHQLHLEQPDRFVAVLVAFLTDSPVPWPAWPGSDPPAGYRGTR